MPSLGLIEWILIVAGLALMAAGARVVWRDRATRAVFEQTDGADPSEPAPPEEPDRARHVPAASGPLSRATRPTRLTIGVAALVVGYHLTVWALPPGVGVKVPAERWYLVVGGAALAVIGSLLMDRLQPAGRGRGE